jgi:hypothetical protein
LIHKLEMPSFGCRSYCCSEFNIQTLQAPINFQILGIGVKEFQKTKTLSYKLWFDYAYSVLVHLLRHGYLRLYIKRSKDICKDKFATLYFNCKIDCQKFIKTCVWWRTLSLLSESLGSSSWLSQNLAGYESFTFQLAQI